MQPYFFTIISFIFEFSAAQFLRA